MSHYSGETMGMICSVGIGKTKLVSSEFAYECPWLKLEPGAYL